MKRGTDHRRPIRAGLIALTFFAPPALAQSRVGARIGLTGSSTLVRDSIVQALSIRPNLAPTIGFWIESRLDLVYRVDLGLDMAWSQLTQHTPGAAAADVVPLTSWTPTISLRRLVHRNIAARATMGALIYDPDQKTSNLFRRGAPVFPLLGLGATMERSVGGGLLLTLDLRYDFHRFTTASLRDAGFVGQRPVHRLTLALGVSRGL